VRLHENLKDYTDIIDELDFKREQLSKKMTSLIEDFFFTNETFLSEI